MNGPSIEHTLYDLFAGRATPLQKQAVEEWLRTAENREVYYQLLARYEAKHAQYEPDTARALTNFEQFMKGHPYPRHQVGPRSETSVFTVSGSAQARRNWPATRWVLGMAASLLAVVGLGYVTHDQWAYEKIDAPFGQTTTITLADGSDVTLNAHSSLRVPRFGFGNSDRHVWLTGEGYFSVRHTTRDHTFTVHTPNLDVQVLGTRFNVNTRSGQTEVVLDEGKVQLVQPKAPAHPLTLKPGDQATLAEGDTAFHRRVVALPEQVAAYRQNRLVFTDTPLSKVASAIQDYYGIRVVVSSRELARRELTGTLPNNDLNVVLRSLSVSYNLAVERRVDQVVLKPQ
ncbi:anti-FecI sigma factor, FecR [Fibrella aestuarina BUZ 2]|uniref:Anti-FecI sigma factor, FecR n=1 Tax=Fibrella aestuarina BUZ 2 TaxID=1166018 RepID=I0K7S0_9BACT|nr:FecR domain-containing protein [Fibrella aestuarina]CCH00173.1 anti-FecI sigma factor, FecR [Fibrella aestuarina BUZ 2]